MLTPNGTPQFVDLLIRLNPQTGAIQVQGPIDNPMLAFGMLEMTKGIIAARQAKRDATAQTGIVVVEGGLPDGNGFGG
jgi:hypothetical protein